jgi:DNA-binding LacI/PurR family transcriptional regulator
VVPAFEARDAFLAAAARRQVDYLASRGHREVMFVAPSEPRLRAMASLRRSAARRAARRHSLSWAPPLVLPSDHDQAVDALRRSMPGRDRLAVCAFNDDVALAVLSAAHGAGIPVPDSLAVIGVDDAPAARTSCPALTTVRADLDSFVASSVQAFIAAAQGLPFEIVRLPSTFDVVSRASG